MTRRVVALVDDLMVRSRIEAAAAGDAEVSFPRDADQLVARLDPPPDLILVGLAATRLPWPELIRAARQAAPTVPVIAFGPHRDLALRSRALEAGADRVLANSALMVALPELLRGRPLRASEQ
jgi:DNA-binding NarL/FixJ family response regulator